MKLSPLRAMLPAALLVLLLVGDRYLEFSTFPSAKIYDALCSLREAARLPPPGIGDIVLVGIDSQTIQSMPERWPYSRATFAKALQRIREANPLAIGFDFGFFGDSTPQEDGLLRRLLLKKPQVILGASLKEGGGVQFSTLSGLPIRDLSGLVNKLRDPDGVTRGALTYLRNTHPNVPQAYFFSWEMKLLEAAGCVRLSEMEDRGDALVFPSAREERRRIPVDPVTKAFLIRFSAHTEDFQRISFYDLLAGKVPPRRLQGKIVLIGFLTELLQDIHRTPIGWLPGLTLNANAFLSLYAQDFLRPLPRAVEIPALLLGALAGCFLLSRSRSRWRRRLLLAGIGALFLLGSHFLFGLGYTLNYALFLAGWLIIPALSFRLLGDVK